MRSGVSRKGGFAFGTNLHRRFLPSIRSLSHVRKILGPLSIRTARVPRVNGVERRVGGGYSRDAHGSPKGLVRARVVPKLSAASPSRLRGKIARSLFKYEPHHSLSRAPSRTCTTGAEPRERPGERMTVGVRGGERRDRRFPLFLETPRDFRRIVSASSRERLTESPGSLDLVGEDVSFLYRGIFYAMHATNAAFRQRSLFIPPSPPVCRQELLHF